MMMTWLGPDDLHLGPPKRRSILEMESRRMIVTDWDGRIIQYRSEGTSTSAGVEG
ncbi:hypothetical protein BJX96DRAFT_160456 [Aspergillus floccosus]